MKRFLWILLLPFLIGATYTPNPLPIDGGNTTDVSIDDGGNSITVDGTVTSNLSATDNAVLDQIELNTDDLLTTTDYNASFGTSGTADSQVMSVQGIEGMITLQVSRRLKWIESNSFDVDASSVQLVDTDASTSGAADLQTTCKEIHVTNAGDGNLFLRVGGSAPVADGSTAYYDRKLARGETEKFYLGYESATSTANDIYAIRSGAETNDNVIVTQYTYH